MAVDRRAGKKLEVDDLSGAVARMGDENGIPTPVNKFIAQALAVDANGRAV